MQGDQGPRSGAARVRGVVLCAVWVAAMVAGCGGGGHDEAARSTPADALRPSEQPKALAGEALVQFDAVRLANQASFGPTEQLVSEIRSQGAPAWVAQQMTRRDARYSSGGGDDIHRNVGDTFFCDQPAHAGVNCWRDWLSTDPLSWDFYRNAVTQPDQLRQRVAFALQQMLVVNSRDVAGTYGFRNYHNLLLDQAFGNYRELLKKVALSPVMGDFLNNANNDAKAPNENFARELLQLFSIGTCLLQPNGNLAGAACTPTYDNRTVREYAYALTGWTYPSGGSTIWGCWPKGTQCRYYGGDMMPAAAVLHDSQVRQLLSGVSVPAGSTPASALDKVLDSLMQHPNTAPFIGRQLIQHLVMSNPPPAYVQRVAGAFTSGRYTHASGGSFGSGNRGDLAATVAAILLDSEARGGILRPVRGGKLREPVLMFTGVLRALGGHTDGAALNWWWGDLMRQHVFRAPSVFNFYPPDHPLAGTSLVGPAFAIHNADTALLRLNYLTFLLDWGGLAAEPSVPGATGTHVDLSGFTGDAADAARLVDRLALLVQGKPLPEASRTNAIKAVSWWTAAADPANWRLQRVRAAAYLVFAEPASQVQR
jgi:uncharacterized protein (DUF1800 family)